MGWFVVLGASRQVVCGGASCCDGLRCRANAALKFSFGPAKKNSRRVCKQTLWSNSFFELVIESRKRDPVRRKISKPLTEVGPTAYHLPRDQRAGGGDKSRLASHCVELDCGSSPLVSGDFQSNCNCAAAMLLSSYADTPANSWSSDVFSNRFRLSTCRIVCIEEGTFRRFLMMATST